MPYHLSDAAYDSHQFLEGPYMRIPKEIGCAFAASALVSPIVSIMDKAMVQEITGIRAFMVSMRDAGREMVLSPKKFFRGLSFRLTLAVYFGTYAVANCTEAALDFYKIREEEKRKQLKVSAASTANVSLLAWRDSIFAREFSRGGHSKIPDKTPLRTVSLFALRDTCTMAATFYAAPKAANWLIQEHDINRDTANLSMALIIPVLAQFLTAPIHIHAMDYYARPNASISEWCFRIKQEFQNIAFARGLRILPAFGIGSYSNNKFREMTISQPDEDLLLTHKVVTLIRRATQPAFARHAEMNNEAFMKRN
jgi:hypothetical protein